MSGRPAAERRGVTGEVVTQVIEEAKEAAPFLQFTFLQSIWRFFTDHPAFADEVIREDWRRKMKPLPFVGACFLVALAAGEWAEAHKPVMALDLLKELPQLTAEIQQTLPPDGITSSTTATDLAGVLQEKGRATLAEEVRKAPRPEDQAPHWIIYPVLLLYFVPQWRLMHRFLKAPHRTPRQTAHLFMYTTGIFFLVASISTFAEAYPTMQGMETVFAFALLVLVWRWLRIVKYTHGAGFWRMVGAAIKVNIVLVVPVLLLFGVMRLIAGSP